MRRSGADLLIESPRSWCSIAVHDPGVMGALAAFTGRRAWGRCLHRWPGGCCPT
jgi:hypothetical protein